MCDPRPDTRSLETYARNKLCNDSSSISFVQDRKEPVPFGFRCFFIPLFPSSFIFLPVFSSSLPPFSGCRHRCCSTHAHDICIGTHYLLYSGPIIKHTPVPDREEALSLWNVWEPERTDSGMQPGILTCWTSIVVEFAFVRDAYTNWSNDAITRRRRRLGRQRRAAKHNRAP